MKFFPVVALAFLLFFSSILILGVISGSDFNQDASITVEAPQVVVLKELIDFGNYQKWCPNITKSIYNPEIQLRETTYLMDGHEVNIREKVQVIASENIILFTEQDGKSRGYIQHIINEIHLKENSDGTTEVQWKIQYTLKPIISKMLNMFVVRPVFRKILVQNLNALKKNFER